MSILSLRRIVTTIFGFLILQLIGSFTSANVKTFASKRGFDTHLDKLADYPWIAAIVEWCRRMSWLGSLGRLGVIMVPLGCRMRHKRSSCRSLTG